MLTVVVCSWHCIPYWNPEQRCREEQPDVLEGAVIPKEGIKPLSKFKRRNSAGTVQLDKLEVSKQLTRGIIKLERHEKGYNFINSHDDPHT